MNNIDPHTDNTEWLGMMDAVKAQRKVSPAKKKKSKTSKRNKKNVDEGNRAQKQACDVLTNSIGHLRADPIPTKRTYVFAQMGYRGQPLFRQVKMERANGDIYSMDANGRLCLSEVKSHDAETLPWGQLTRTTTGGKYHQSENLDGHMALHPLVSSYLIWVRGKETAVLQWPVDGFDKPRTSIKWADALEWRVNK